MYGIIQNYTKCIQDISLYVTYIFKNKQGVLVNTNKF